VAQKLTLSSLSAGAHIWPADNSILAWRFIISGIVAAVTPAAKGVCKAQTIYGSEAWFGENQIINVASSYIKYVSATDVELLNMPAPIFLYLLDREPVFSAYMTRLVSWRAQCESEVLMLMKAGNPCLRTVIGLGMIFEAMAAKSNLPITENMTDSITIPVKQEVLAQLCGVSRTSLWENMSRLEDEGWLNVHYSKLELLKLPTWRAVMRRRRGSPTAKMDTSIEEILLEFHRADLALPPPDHMHSRNVVTQ
jgi:CRP-like cAMP-binding protein